MGKHYDPKQLGGGGGGVNGVGVPVGMSGMLGVLVGVAVGVSRVCVSGGIGG